MFSYHKLKISNNLDCIDCNFYRLTCLNYKSMFIVLFYLLIFGKNCGSYHIVVEINIHLFFLQGQPIFFCPWNCLMKHPSLLNHTCIFLAPWFFQWSSPTCNRTIQFTLGKGSCNEWGSHPPLAWTWKDPKLIYVHSS